MQLSIRSLTRSGVLAALSVLLALYVKFPLFPSAPYLLYEPSDVPLLISSALLGPGWAAGISAVTALVLGAAAGGGAIGVLSRFLGSAALGVGAALVFRRSGRFWPSVAAGGALYVAVEVLLTLVTGPLFLGLTLCGAAMMSLTVVVPFNLLKVGINAVLALPVWTVLQRLGAGAAAPGRGLPTSPVAYRKTAPPHCL